MDFIAALLEGGDRRELVVVGSRPDGAAQPGGRTMLTVSEMLSLAESKRDKAEHARRCSSLLATPEDQGRLLVFAQELDDEADDLERRACPALR